RRLGIAFAHRELQRRQATELLRTALRVRRRLGEATHGALGGGDFLVEALLRFGLLFVLLFLALGGVDRILLVLLDDGATQARAVDELLDALASRRSQVRVATGRRRRRARADVRALRDQIANRFRIGVRGGPHERRRAAQLFLRVD